ncbi:MAG TPA: beta-propeller fold lactonase family protein [Acidobacteriaceae bacterium]|jgi:hypothetical protein
MHRLPLVRFLSAALVTASVISLSGCHNFFSCEGKASCPSSGSGTGSGNYLYLSNSSKGGTYLNGYDVSTGALTVLSGFPTNISITPTAMVITPSNGFLFVSTTTAIYSFAISSTGGLTTVNSGAAVATPPAGVQSMDISPDGNYLYALDLVGGSVVQYTISSTGLLSNQLSFSFPIPVPNTNTAQAVKVAPNGNFVVCAVGTGGDLIYAYSSTAGITNATPAVISTGSATAGDFGVAIDTSNFLYLSRTTGPVVFAVNAASGAVPTATLVNQTNALSTGGGPHAIALSSTAGGNVYIGNLSASSISGYSEVSGVLTNLSGSPYTAPSTVDGLGRDKSGKYLVAVGYAGTGGVQLYTIGASGALTAGATDATGTTTSIPTALALTH